MADSFSMTDSVAADLLWGGIDTCSILDAVEAQISVNYVRSITDAALDLTDDLVVELNAVEVVATELKPTVRLLVG
jgi:hypothetical protein